MQAIILAGGFGSRLSTIIKDIPKSMVPINGVPFLDLVINNLLNQGIKKIVLAVGYKKELIIDHYKKSSWPITFSIEEEPLGTGGAIKQALLKVDTFDALVLNGDSFLDFSLKTLFSLHKEKKATVTIACQLCNDASRFGTLQTTTNGKIISFHEKSFSKGIISCGIYIMKKESLEKFPKVFSIEKEAFPKLPNMFACSFSGTFIDIGTPDSYNLAQELLKPITNQFFKKKIGLIK